MIRKKESVSYIAGKCWYIVDINQHKLSEECGPWSQYRRDKISHSCIPVNSQRTCLNVCFLSLSTSAFKKINLKKNRCVLVNMSVKACSLQRFLRNDIFVHFLSINSWNTGKSLKSSHYKFESVSSKTQRESMLQLKPHVQKAFSFSYSF